MNLKTLSKIIMVISAVSLYIAFNIDTSVATSDGRVNNIGLLTQQQNILLIACVGFIAGIVLFATAKLKQTPEDEQLEKNLAEARVSKISDMLEQKLKKWLFSPRDKVIGRAVVFLISIPFVNLTSELFEIWFPTFPIRVLLLSGFAIYAWRPISGIKVIKHLLFFYLIYIVIAYTYLFFQI